MSEHSSFYRVTQGEIFLKNFLFMCLKGTLLLMVYNRETAECLRYLEDIR